MKRITVIVLNIFSIVLFLSGCGSTSEIFTDDNYVDKQSEEIIICFDNSDVESLKSMFCLGSQKYYDLDAQIQNAFDKYEGKSISYSVTDKMCTGGQDYGEVVDKHYIPYIKNIETDEQMTYIIGYCTFEVYKFDSNLIGIGVLTLYDEEENEIATIGGYDWIN